MGLRLTAAAALGLLLLGCAAKRVTMNLPAGRLGAVHLQDCRLDPGLAIVSCACDKFDIEIDARSGNTVLRCPR